MLIRRIKFAEILIMLAGALGMLLGNLPLLLVVLFCMGTQSALFGPVKYSILPQQLTEDELVGGNALVEMGTFLAILGGTIGAGVLMASDAYAEWVALSVVLIAPVGYRQSRDSRRDGRLANLTYGLARAAPVVADSAAGLRPAARRVTAMLGNSGSGFSVPPT